MKKHYLKLITTISSSILSYSLVIVPFTSNASMKTIRQSPKVNHGISGRILFKPIDSANKSTSNKLQRPVPINPLTTQFNPIYDSDSNSVSSNSLGSAGFPSTLGSIYHNNSNTSNTNTSTTTSLQNASNSNSSRNSNFKLKFTDFALIGVSAMSITGLGITINNLVDTNNNKTDNKPKLNEPVN